MRRLAAALLLAFPACWSGAPAAAQLVCPFLPATVTALPAAFWGMAANQNLPGGNTLENHALLAAQLAGTGVGRVKMRGLRWNAVQPDPGAPPDWGDLPLVWDLYDDWGFDLVVTVGRTPEWASSVPGCAPTCGSEPPDLEAWSEFVGEAAASFAGLVDVWEIWNEPNNPDSFHGTPEEYVAMLNAAYVAIRAADPEAEVWGPVTITGCEGVGPFEIETARSGSFDAFATHIYCAEGTPRKLELLQQVHTLLEESGLPEAPVQITETNERVALCDVDPLQQADLLEELYSCFAAAGAASVFWWKPTDTCRCPSFDGPSPFGKSALPETPEVDCPSPDDVFENGILDTDYLPKPAYWRLTGLITATPLFTSGFEPGDGSEWDQEVE